LTPFIFETHEASRSARPERANSYKLVGKFKLSSQGQALDAISDDIDSAENAFWNSYESSTCIRTQLHQLCLIRGNSRLYQYRLGRSFSDWRGLRSKNTCTRSVHWRNHAGVRKQHLWALPADKKTITDL